MYLWAFLGMAAGNFLYQAITASDWETAFERTFFQAIAVGLIWLLSLGERASS